METFGLDQKIEGKSILQHMSDLIVKNEKAELSLVRVRNSNETFKQMNNHINLRIKAAKIDIRQKELEQNKK